MDRILDGTTGGRTGNTTFQGTCVMHLISVEEKSSRDYKYFKRKRVEVDSSVVFI